jgi:HTH-type transcriptional regulator/antitoxin HigA
MSYQPRRAVHPGKTIERLLGEMGMSQKWLADRTGLTEKHISTMINGNVSITEDTALRLSNALGGSPEFWVNLNSNYHITKAKLDQENRAESEAGILDEIPYAELANLGWVDKVKNPRDKITKVLNLYKFFGINSIDQIQLTQQVAFRQTSVKNLNPYSLAAWLRRGEIAAEKISLPEYSSEKLRKAIPAIRKLTYDAPKDFYPKLQSILQEAGVGLVAVANPKRTSVHGATRWNGENPLIQVSIHGKNADKMWFSLFHEIGHVLKHGKREKFISFEKIENNEQEREADEFATESLLPTPAFIKFVRQGDFSLSAVKAFAKSVMISPDVIMGRLEHEGIVDYSVFARSHTKLCMAEGNE